MAIILQLGTQKPAEGNLPKVTNLTKAIQRQASPELRFETHIFNPFIPTSHTLQPNPEPTSRQVWPGSCQLKEWNPWLPVHCSDPS